MIRAWLAVYAYWLGALCAALVALAVAVSIAVILRRRVDAPVDESDDIVAGLFAPTGKRAATDTAEWRPAHTRKSSRPRHSRREHNAHWTPDRLASTQRMSADQIARAIGDQGRS